MARPVGSKNKIGAMAKASVVSVFNGMGGIEGMMDWARKHPTDFYKIYSKLIPANSETDVTLSVQQQVDGLSDEQFRVLADACKRIGLSASDTTAGAQAGNEGELPQVH